MTIRINRKRGVALAILALLAIAAGGAYAYFTGANNSTDQAGATVGSATPFTIAFTGSSGTMYPGVGSTTIDYTITNGGTGNEAFSSVTSTVVAEGNGDVEENGVNVPGCLASWFTVDDSGAPTPGTIDPTDDVTGNTVISMTDSGSDQDPCQGVTPDINVAVS